MSALLAHEGLPPGMDRTKLRQLVGEFCTEVLGLPTLATAYLNHILGRTQPSDFEAGRICGAWPSPTEIARRLGKSVRQINSIELLLEREGLILRTNGRSSRRGHRQGAIRWLEGINLAPLVARVEELSDRLIEVRKAEALHEQALRAESQRIRELRRQIRETGADPAEADAVSNAGRVSRIRDAARLREMADALEAIVDMVAAQSGEPQTAHRSAENRAPNTTPQSSPKSCSAPNELNSDATSVTLPQVLLVATPQYRERLAAHGKPTWRALEDTSRQVAIDYGIRAASWQAMCRRWSPAVAALSIVLIERNTHLPDNHRWRARSFGRCFHGLAKQPANLVRMLHAAMGWADGPFVERRLEIESRCQGTGQRIGLQLPGLFANLKITEHSDAEVQ